jgi:hypothetical protein
MIYYHHWAMPFEQILKKNGNKESDGVLPELGDFLVTEKEITLNVK